MTCNADSCNQGRKPCPCPEACQLPEDDESFPLWLLFILCLVGFACAASPFVWM